MTDQNQTVPDLFDIELSLMGSPVVGFSMTSTSPKKNWAFFGILSMFAVAALVSSMSPILVALANGG